MNGRGDITKELLLAAFRTPAGMSSVANRHYGTDHWHLIRTAFHEHSHAVVSRFHGLTSKVTITSQRQGFCSHEGAKDAGVMREISLAGSIGEQFISYGLGQRADSLHSSLLIAMSPSDAEGAGDFTRADVEKCATRVRSLWGQIKKDAVHSIADFEVVHGMWP